MNVCQIDLETFILEQLVLHGIILFITGRAVSQQLIWWRMLIGALAAALYGLMGAFIELSSSVQVLVNMLAGCIILWLAFDMKSSAQLVLLNFVFYVVSLFMGGFIYCLSANPGTQEILWGMICSVIFFVIAGRILVSQLRLRAYIGRVWLYEGNNFVEMNGFLDTGNTLYTSDGIPIIIVEQQMIGELFVDNEERENFEQKKCCVVSCGVINGTKHIKCFRPDKIYIKWPGRPRQIVIAAVGIVNHTLSQQRQYQALLHQQFI